MAGIVLSSSASSPRATHAPLGGLADLADQPVGDRVGDQVGDAGLVELLGRGDGGARARSEGADSVQRDAQVGFSYRLETGGFGIHVRPNEGPVALAPSRVEGGWTASG
ncbi:hypothetical protein GCM10009800_03570 [Nocardiopsis rhodophaea]